MNIVTHGLFQQQLVYYPTVKTSVTKLLEAEKLYLVDG